MVSKLNSEPTGFCIQPFATRIHRAEKFEPNATNQVTTKCCRLESLSHPKKNKPTNVDSRKKATSASIASGAPKMSPT
ncbi:Uncharacterised protein [Vibrio cholerae]|nr:Uncharacterised protein [Vibrio cholerae]CSI09186.1 Uncharacterised protein [Vibrio cholerae]CSI56606.1 Uncharacterised protein [Vibrio cholerae]